MIQKKTVHYTGLFVFSVVEGVANGFKKELDLIGVGYRAQNKVNKLVLNVGLSPSWNSNQLKVPTLKFPQTLKYRRRLR